MPTLMERIRELVAAGRFRPSDHGAARMLLRGISQADLAYGIADAILVEEYPVNDDDDIGPATLLLQYDAASRPLHVVWGIKSADTDMAWVVTTYRPDTDARWEADFVTRRQG